MGNPGTPEDKEPTHAEEETEETRVEDEPEDGGDGNGGEKPDFKYSG